MSPATAASGTCASRQAVAPRVWRREPRAESWATRNPRQIIRCVWTGKVIRHLIGLTNTNIKGYTVTFMTFGSPLPASLSLSLSLLRLLLLSVSLAIGEKKRMNLDWFSSLLPPPPFLLQYFNRFALRDKFRLHALCEYLFMLINGEGKNNPKGVFSLSLHHHEERCLRPSREGGSPIPTARRLVHYNTIIPWSLCIY